MTALATETVSAYQIAVGLKSQVPDPTAKKIIHTIREFLKINISDLKIIKLFTIHKELSLDVAQEIAETLFIDPVVEELHQDDETYDWSIEVTLKKGMTDNAGQMARLTIEDFLKKPFAQGEYVTASTRYLFKGKVSDKEAEQIAKGLLANPLIEDIHISTSTVTQIDLNISDEALVTISKQRLLALSLEEMKIIRNHFKKLNRNPTDVELEAIAQTWSEHCKHKIFNAVISYTENGKKETINGLFPTYIKGATTKINKEWLVSVFTDNAGIIRYNDTHNIAFKAETHNSPSALDPYGGALTGILGVNRDIMGAGIGARLIANTDVFCFAPPNYDKPLPPRLHHPKRVFEGVRLGVEHGGNKSGIPTINGSICFDERFLGKPLVYCGSVGIMPREVNGKESHLKEISKGDLIVIAGGRTGRDGIHGATFSSEELHAGSPSSAVQIGDPFTQKKLHDFLLEARDLGLYHTLTDNGAGGFSSSVGELAQISNGCEIHLDQALLKDPSLQPWEILLSESQERMTLAVDPKQWQQLRGLAAFHEVEICTIGTFTNSGNFHVLYDGKTVAQLSLDFLHNGLPRMQLKAEWKAPAKKAAPANKEAKQQLHELLSSYNICSKESVIRQYDHEVQGGSVIKPLTGKYNDGPSDAAIFRPIESMPSNRGIVVSHGICPQYSDEDTYYMAFCAVDEAVRNAVAVGADPDRIAILDNFCWPDPIEHPEKNPDGAYKLAQLVRACKALYDTACEYGTPIISGKDSMKNDYMIDGIKISIPPTLLISAIATMDDVTKSVSMDVKCPGDHIYLIEKQYRAIHIAMMQGLVASCHDCSEGGIAVALAEKAFAGGLGMEVEVDDLFSELPCRLIATVSPQNAAAFEKMVSCEKIGAVRSDNKFIIKGILEDNINDLKASWQNTLSGGVL